MPRARLGLVAVVAAALIMPSTALAQSGTPGADGAADGVYGGGDVLGPPDTPNNPDPSPDPGDPGSGNVAGPGDPDTQSVPFAASDNGGGGDDNASSVPFTGFYALLVLAVGAGLLVVGAGLRRVGRKPPPAG